MVNARFPAAGDHGFQMVHTLETLRPPAARENLRRIKSTVFSANFLRSVRIADTCDLSAAVIEE
jgi:hypothetical protein